jgi:hypothetical protein
MRLILAHCALTDRSWIWERVPDTPNVFFDTSWWGPVHLMSLFALVPPGRILNASDLPYCTPLSSALTTMRCAYQAGLSEEQIASVLSGQSERLISAAEPLDVGGCPRGERRPVGPLLEPIAAALLTAMESMQRGSDPGNSLVVARHGCKVPADHPDAPIVRSVEQLLDLYDSHGSKLPKRNQFAPGWDVIAAAAIVARTPAAPLPAC